MNLLLRTASIFSALALSASLASADPLTFDFNASIGTGGAFTKTYSFNLSQGANFSGALTTTSSKVGNMSIVSVLLSNGSMQYKFDTLGDGFNFDAITSSQSTTTVKGYPVSNFSTNYLWNPVFLANGDWTVTIVGSEVDSKYGGLLNLQLVDPPASVPEPQSLLLAAGALGALAIVRRRSKSNRG